MVLLVGRDADELFGAVEKMAPARVEALRGRAASFLARMDAGELV